jgi:NTE family protein
VGLALGGGAARGIAHVGVLQVLEENQIPIDCVAGTSAGAIAGGFYAAGVTPQRMEEMIKNLSWSTLAKPTLPRFGLLDFDKIMPWIENNLGGAMTFDDLRLPFAAVAADITSGELVAINEGPVSMAMRASSSVPGFFTPIRFKDRLLVDGGILNNLPVSVVRRLGADYVIAVDLIPPGTVGGKEPRNVLELTITSLYMLMRSTQTDGLRADQVILPDIGHVGLADLSKAQELLDAGRAAAEKVVPSIKRDLGLE